ncbi:hypothetical protein TNCV_4567281 [Trichonephila clavipes]|nr:hypothetical protein TNCV_4567281 [Trichonephila clavipes]
MGVFRIMAIRKCNICAPFCMVIITVALQHRDAQKQNWMQESNFSDQLCVTMTYLEAKKNVQLVIGVVLWWDDMVRVWIHLFDAFGVIGRASVTFRDSRAVGNLVVRASDSRPKSVVPCLNCGGGDRWCRHLSSLREFLRAQSYCNLYGAQGLGQRQAYI